LRSTAWPSHQLCALLALATAASPPEPKGTMAEGASSSGSASSAANDIAIQVFADTGGESQPSQRAARRRIVRRDGRDACENIRPWGVVCVPGGLLCAWLLMWLSVAVCPDDCPDVVIIIAPGTRRRGCNRHVTPKLWLLARRGFTSWPRRCACRSVLGRSHCSRGALLLAARALRLRHYGSQ
jgi:hypothetical protein